MKRLLAILMTIAATQAIADTIKTAELTWIAPTMRADNTPIKPEEVKGYSIQYQRNAEPVKTLDAKLANAITIPNLGPGSYKFSASVLLTDGLDSGYSQPVNVVIGSQPNAPTLTIKFTCTQGCSGSITAQ